MTVQVEAGAPHTGCYGCSSPEGEVELCVKLLPGATETGTVVKLGEKGAARGGKGLWTRTGCPSLGQKSLHNPDSQTPQPGIQRPTHPSYLLVSPCYR